jgi:hypothetical protein
MKRRLASVLTALGCGIAVTAYAADSAGPRVPDFSGFWGHGVTQIVFTPVAGAPSPVIDVLNVACTPNCPPRPSGQPFIGDHSNPILTPTGAAAVKAMGDIWRSGQPYNAATELCAPSGVPHIITVFGGVQFLQTPEMVVIVYHRDQQVRWVYLNRPHSANPKPSWYGESVGHYEGDTLVIDTIGLNDKSIVDRFGAPQTETTHVVERYRISDDGMSLVAHVTVEDPKIFTTAWQGTVTYTKNRNNNIPGEERCAENNKDAATGADYPIPMARPDEPRY